MADKTLIDTLKLSLIKLSGRLPLNAARAIGRLLGWLISYTHSRNTRVTRTNIELCFATLPKNQQRALIKRSLEQTHALIFETCVVWSHTPQWVAQHTLNSINESVLLQAMQAQKGVLILAPHLGNWEALGYQLVKYGPITSMFQPPKHAFLGEFIYNKRQSADIKLAPTSVKGVAMCLKALKKGENVGILPDQNPMLGGGFAPFFNIDTHTITLIHGLITRTQCRVVASYMKRVKSGFELHFIEPHSDIYADDEQTSLNGLNATVERCVKQCPEQYQWEYKRFKTQPHSAQNRYKNKKV